MVVMMNKELGKITSVHFGFGGYQDAMFGISFGLGGDSWGVSDFWGEWAERPEYAKWTIEDQNKKFAEVTKKIHQLLLDAKVETIDKLKNKPIEVTFDGTALKSWRILTEVL